MSLRSAVAMLGILSIAFAFGCGGRSSSVRASGVVEMDEIDVASFEGGRVVRLDVAESDSVRAGDTLAVLHRSELAAQVQAQVAEANRLSAQSLEVKTGPRAEDIRIARADLASARGQLDLAEKQLTRTRALVEAHVASQEDLDRAEAARNASTGARDAAQERLAALEAGSRHEEITAAREAATSAHAQAEAIQSRLGELVLIAPSHGVVLLKNFVPGELVQPGQPVVTLGNPDSLWVRVYVAAPEIGRVRIGAHADVIATGFGQRTFPGRVVSIATSAEFTPRAALTEEERANLVFAVKIMMDPSGGALRPGLPVDVRIAPPELDSGARR